MRRTLAIALLALLVRTAAAAAALPETAPLTLAGPDGSSMTLSASNRLRGEFAGWAAVLPVRRHE